MRVNVHPLVWRFDMELLTLVNELTSRGFVESYYSSPQHSAWEIHILKKNGLIIAINRVMLTIDFMTVRFSFRAEKVSYANNTITIEGAGTIRI